MENSTTKDPFTELVSLVDILCSGLFTKQDKNYGI